MHCLVVNTRIPHKFAKEMREKKGHGVIMWNTSMGLEPGRELLPVMGRVVKCLCLFLPLSLFTGSFAASACGVLILAPLCSSSLFCSLKWPYSSPYHPHSRSGATEQLTHREKHGKVIMFQVSSWERDQIGWVMPLNHFCLLDVPRRPTPYPVCSGWATWFWSENRLEKMMGRGGQASSKASSIPKMAELKC